MYQEFFQLKENPFNVTADPDFFFSSPSHRDAISNLLYGVNQRKGILVITGEIGTGKTTLCRTLLKHLDQQTKAALILNPNFTETQLLQIILNDFGISISTSNKAQLIQALNDFLIKAATHHENVVIIIDEAQHLNVKQLENIRLLSNIETEKEKLLQIILVGQPELHQRLQLPQLRQLRQRISIHFNLSALDKIHLEKYILHRLRRASNGTSNAIQFTDGAFQKIFDYTQGSPRTINILCDRALLASYVAETRFIDEAIIDRCAKEVLNW